MYSAVLDAATIPVIGYVLGDTRCCGRGVMAVGFSFQGFVNWLLRPLSGSYVYPLELCPACTVLGRACPVKAVFGGVPRLAGAYCHWWHGWGRLLGTRCRRQGPRGADAAVGAYLVSRSRRGAFLAGGLSVLSVAV